MVKRRFFKDDHNLEILVTVENAIEDKLFIANFLSALQILSVLE